MKRYIETLGGIIEKQTAASPEHTRELLEAAYSWVRFSGKHSHGKDVRSAYKYINGAVAGTIVDSFRHPKESVMVNIFFPCELLHAMKIQPMFPEGISAYVACTACQRVFAEAAEAADVPESFCSYHKTMLGVAEAGVMPAPLMIANTTLACDANQLSFRRLAEFYQVPHTVIDIPHANDEEAVHYVADQLRALTPQLEELCRRRLDPQVLRETVACSKRTIEFCREYLKKRGGVSLPATMTGELCTLISNHVMLGRPESERYMQRMLRAVEAAPAALPGKKRIFWMHILPNWQDSMKDILEASGRCELVGTDIAADSLPDMDPDHPYESMARRVVESMCNGPAGRRIDMVLHYAKAAGADGVIVFCHWGCKQTLGLSQLAKQRLEAEGLPTLVLDGDGCDARNVADGQMVTRVNAFLEQLEGLHA
ncbi:2-hydroxyacyl-CoA dehydratase subunit D [uncultured Dysosmobacter sp.]|uniref:2-hydroxyacyl-CoA dehydratase subunit D n=1 Tax=uncultured Dysosmobacter sp. TaxID=2591384 RepID=UPI0026180665|nr:2-hydroxyacyl-CoA dehydratase family protein [uncultured Dysosmobacter sp.]